MQKEDHAPFGSALGSAFADADHAGEVPAELVDIHWINPEVALCGNLDDWQNDDLARFRAKLRHEWWDIVERKRVMVVPRAGDIITVNLMAWSFSRALVPCVNCGLALLTPALVAAHRPACPVREPKWEAPDSMTTMRMLPFSMAGYVTGINASVMVAKIGPRRCGANGVTTRRALVERLVPAGFSVRELVDAMGKKVVGFHPHLGRVQGIFRGITPCGGLAEVDIGDDPVLLAAIGMRQNDLGLPRWTPDQPIFPRLWLDPATVRPAKRPKGRA